MLNKKYGKIIENELIKYIIQNETKIKALCTDKTSRENILDNVMKKIETTHIKGFLIKDGTGTFIDLSKLSPNKIVFDTGNGSVSFINKDFAQILNLPVKDTFKIITSGVTGDSSESNKYVEIEIKIDDNFTNHKIKDKIYKFKAYIQDKGIYNILLLGQSANGLKSFFDDSYCIGFNSNRANYELMKQEALDLIKIHEANLKSLISIFENFNTNPQTLKNLFAINKLNLDENNISTNIRLLLDIDTVNIDEIYKLAISFKIIFEKSLGLIKDQSFITANAGHASYGSVITKLDKIKEDYIDIL